MESYGELKTYKMGRNLESVSHIFYADDMLILTNGSMHAIYYQAETVAAVL